MRALRYAVAPFEDGWRILVEGERLARFDDQPSAVSAVLAMARSVAGSGQEVEVLLHNSRGDVAALEVGEFVEPEPRSFQPLHRSVRR